MVDDDLLELYTQEIRINKWTDQGQSGRPIYSEPGELYLCRIVAKTKTVRTLTGDEKVSNRQVYLASAPGVTPKDKLTLPDGTAPVILSVDAYPDENGDYTETINL